MNRLGAATVVGFGGLLSLLTIVGLFGSTYWLFDVVAHWRLQYAVLLLLLFVLGLFVLQPRSKAFWLLPALLVNLWLIAPFFVPQVDAVGGGETLKVIAININAHNGREEEVYEYVRQADADIVQISEMTPQQLARFLQVLPDAYPYRVDVAQGGHFGMVLFSRLPIASSTVHRLGVRGYPSIEAVVEWAGRAITVYGAHPHPPLGAWGTAWRDSEMTEMNEVIAGISGPLVLLGDLNAAPWTYTATRLTEAGELRSAALGHGIWPTWWLGSRLLGLPFDHIFISSEWSVEGYQLGPEVGSDHLPVMAELHLQD